MEIRAICQSDKLWEKTIEYALKCPWKAGPFLGRAMKENHFFLQYIKHFFHPPHLAENMTQ